MLDLVKVHSKGLGGAVYVGSSPLKVLTGGQEGRLCVREESSPANETQEVMRVENNAINCIAGHPRQTHYAIADQSKGVFVSHSLPMQDPLFPNPHGDTCMSHSQCSDHYGTTISIDKLPTSINRHSLICKE